MAGRLMGRRPLLALAAGIAALLAGIVLAVHLLRLLVGAAYPVFPEATSSSPIWAYGGGVGFVDGTEWPGRSAILIDQKTGVEYLMVQGADGDTDVTLLVNADGSPKVAEE